MTSDNHSSTFGEGFDREEQIEETFGRLRRDGYSRLEAVQVILDALDLSLAEAKRVLLTSDTWAEAADETDASSPSSPPVPPAPG